MVQEFDSYRIYYHTTPRYYWDAMIDLYKAGAPIGRLLFVKTGRSIPSNERQGNFTTLHYSRTHLGNILNILWHEKPLYISLNTVNGIGGLSTSDEPIGEEEG